MTQFLASVYADSNVAKSVRTVVYAVVGLLGVSLESVPVQSLVAHHLDVVAALSVASGVVNFLLNALKERVQPVA